MPHAASVLADRGLPDDEFSLDGDAQLRRLVAQQDLDSLAGDLGEGLANRGDRGAHEGGELDVVESRHHDVLGDAEPIAPQFSNGPDREQIIEADDCVGDGTPLDEVVSRLGGRLDREGALDDI